MGSDFFGGDREEDFQVELDRLLNRLGEVVRRESGKGKEVDRRAGVDEGWEVLWRLGERFKRTEAIKFGSVNIGLVEEVIHR